MISDLFPRERLASALTIYSLGATIGVGTSFMFGGSVVGWVTRADEFVLPLFGAIHSWQAAFLVLGIPGLLLAVVVFSIAEPARRDRFAAAPSGASWWAAYRELLIFMKSRARFFTCHYLGFTLASIVLVGCAAWYAPHIGRHFGWQAAKIGWSLGLTLAAGGVTGQLLGGYLVDALYRRGYRDAPLRCYALFILLAAPVGYFTMTRDSPSVFFGSLFFFILLIQSLPTCIYASLNLVTPNELRGTGTAFFGATSGLIGAGLGPLLVAAVSQYVYRSESAIGLAMATVIAIVCPLAAMTLYLGTRAMRAATADAS